MNQYCQEDIIGKVAELNELRGLPSQIEGSANKGMFDSNPGRLVLDIASAYCYHLYMMKPSGGIVTIYNYLSAREMYMFLEGMKAGIKIK